MTRLSAQAEEQFRKLCDKNGMPYMYINQEQKTFSSGIWASKRPDYYVSLSNLGSIFVDVKAREQHLFFDDIYNTDEPSVPCFHFDMDEVNRFSELEKITSTNVWYAVYPIHKNSLINEVYWIPNNIVSKFISILHHNKRTWNYIQVPKYCFTNEDFLSVDICQDCEEFHCKKINKILEEMWREGNSLVKEIQ